MTLVWIVLLVAALQLATAFQMHPTTQLKQRSPSSSSHTTNTKFMRKIRLEEHNTGAGSDKFAMVSSIRKFPLKVIIAGAPAAGKGTQCEIIKARYGLIHLSTGDILRAAVKAGTPLGVQAKAFMDAGQLVPDDLIMGVVCDRLGAADCRESGWLLDGFPRTKAQADALQAAGMFPFPYNTNPLTMNRHGT